MFLKYIDKIKPINSFQVKKMFRGSVFEFQA